jgi:hypothetical protein
VPAEPLLTELTDSDILLFQCIITNHACSAVDVIFESKLVLLRKEIKFVP